MVTEPSTTQDQDSSAQAADGSVFFPFARYSVRSPYCRGALEKSFLTHPHVRLPRKRLLGVIRLPGWPGKGSFGPAARPGALENPFLPQPRRRMGWRSHFWVIRAPGCLGKAFFGASPPPRRGLPARFRPGEGFFDRKRARWGQSQPPAGVGFFEGRRAWRGMRTFGIPAAVGIRGRHTGTRKPQTRIKIWQEIHSPNAAAAFARWAKTWPMASTPTKSPWA